MSTFTPLQSYRDKIKSEKELLALRHYIITGKKGPLVPELFNKRPTASLLLASSTSNMKADEFKSKVSNNIVWSKQEYLRKLEKKYGKTTTNKDYFKVFADLIEKLEKGEEIEKDSLIKIGFVSMVLTVLYQFDSLQKLVILPEFTFRVYEMQMYGHVPFSSKSLIELYQLIKDATIKHMLSLDHVDVKLENLHEKPISEAVSVEAAYVLLKYNRLTNPYDNHQAMIVHEVLGGTANKNISTISEEISADKRESYCSLYIHIGHKSSKKILPQSFSWGSFEVIESVSYCPLCYGTSHSVARCVLKDMPDEPPAYDQSLRKEIKEKTSFSEVEKDDNSTKTSEDPSVRSRRFSLFKK